MSYLRRGAQSRRELPVVPPAMPAPVSNIFPPSARDALVAASKIVDPTERVREIDRITDRLRITHPKFFVQE